MRTVTSRHSTGTKKMRRGGAGKCPFGGDGKCVISASTEALQIPFVDALNLEAELESLPAMIGLYNACTADLMFVLTLMCY